MGWAETRGVRVVTFGDDALLVELGASGAAVGAASGVLAARRAQLLASSVRKLREASPGLGIGEPVPAASSVLVPFDPLAADPRQLAMRLAALGTATPATPPPARDARVFEVPVRMGGDDGPDLDAVAAETGLGVGAVVELLAAADLEVLFLGFTPGFAYLGGLPPALVVPRLAVPRTRVPAGSVAIAGQYAGIYPHASAGGWRLLGRTDLRLFDPTAAEPVLFRAGDRVRLVPA